MGEHRTKAQEYEATGTYVAECANCDWIGPERLTEARARRDAEEHGQLASSDVPLRWYKLERGAYDYGDTGYGVRWSIDTYEPGEADPDRWASVQGDVNLDWFRTMREARADVEERVAKEES